MNIAENLNRIKDSLPAEVKLVAVTKTHPVEIIMQAYHAGHRIFGENKPQELFDKHLQLPSDVEWHMIGHLQTNKVKHIAPFVKLIHSVDSLKLIEVIQKEAEKNKRTIDCLFQIKIAKEETKSGFDFHELIRLLQSGELNKMTSVSFSGVMGMATFADDFELVRKEFRYLKECFHHLKKEFFESQASFKEISMGMSDDYPVAVEEGATMVRIGSRIFGERNYSK